MHEKKETWEKPELIIINRSYAEENVILTCNQGPITGCDEGTAQVSGSS
jgi:hypothetical protein